MDVICCYLCSNHSTLNSNVVYTALELAPHKTKNEDRTLKYLTLTTIAIRYTPVSCHHGVRAFLNGRYDSDFSQHFVSLFGLSLVP